MNYNAFGTVSIQLPQGPQSDSYNIYLFVNVIDDSHGTTVYTIPTPVSVVPNNHLANSLAASIANNDPASPVFQALNSGNLNLVAKNVIALSSVFNIQSDTTNSDNKSASDSLLSAQNNQMASLRDFLVRKVCDLSVSDLSSIKVISSALSATTQIPEQVTTNTAVCVVFV